MIYLVDLNRLCPKRIRRSAPGGRDATPFPTRRNSFGERTFITNQFWGEDSRGEWSIEVLDTNADGDAARLSEASLDIFGTKAKTITNFIPYLDPEKKLFELPKDYLQPFPKFQDLLNPILPSQPSDKLTHTDEVYYEYL